MMKKVIGGVHPRGPMVVNLARPYPIRNQRMFQAMVAALVISLTITLVLLQMISGQKAS